MASATVAENGGTSSFSHVGIRLPFPRLPAGRGILGDDPIGPASQPGQLQGGRNRQHTVSPDRVAAKQPDLDEHMRGAVWPPHAATGAAAAR